MRWSEPRRPSHRPSRCSSYAEIATHTIDHVASPNVTQIVGARDWLNNVRCAATQRDAAPRRVVAGLTVPHPLPHCSAPLPHLYPPHTQTAGIPKDKIGGFRAPYLIYDAEQRDILQKNGAWGGRVWGGGCVCVWRAACAMAQWACTALCLRDTCMHTPARPAQASGLTRPSLSSTRPRPRPQPPSAYGPTPWTTACPRTAPSGAAPCGCLGAQNECRQGQGWGFGNSQARVHAPLLAHTTAP